MLYLASQSPRRRKLIERLGWPFQVVGSTHRETIRRLSAPSQNAVRNAKGKAAKAILPPGADGIVIGADTFLYFRGRVIGKPKNFAHARRMIGQLAGRSHWVYTGLCLRDIKTNHLRASFAKSKVAFRPLSKGAIARYVVRVHALDKAGGYAVQEDRGELIANIEGSRTNVIGLPVELLRQELAILRRSISGAQARGGDLAKKIDC